MTQVLLNQEEPKIWKVTRVKYHSPKNLVLRETILKFSNKQATFDKDLKKETAIRISDLTIVEEGEKFLNKIFDEIIIAKCKNRYISKPHANVYTSMHRLIHVKVCNNSNHLFRCSAFHCEIWAVWQMHTLNERRVLVVPVKIVTRRLNTCKISIEDVNVWAVSYMLNF